MEIWTIRISGYGTFEFEGTEQEAEEMRKNKAQWERGNGLKYRKCEQEIIDKLVELQCWFFDNEGGCPHWLISQIAEEKLKIIK